MVYLIRVTLYRIVDRTYLDTIISRKRPYISDAEAFEEFYSRMATPLVNTVEVPRSVYRSLGEYDNYEPLANFLANMYKLKPITLPAISFGQYGKLLVKKKFSGHSLFYFKKRMEEGFHWHIDSAELLDSKEAYIHYLSQFRFTDARIEGNYLNGSDIEIFKKLEKLQPKVDPDLTLWDKYEVLYEETKNG